MKLLLLNNKYIENYEAVLKHLNVDYDILGVSDNLEIYDKLMIPGGLDIDPSLYHEANDPTVNWTEIEFDLVQLKAIDYFVKAKKPIFGICRGQQILNVYFGGTLIQDIKSDIEHRQIDGIDAIHFTNNTGLMKELYGERSRINSSHHQAVKDLADGFEVLSVDDDGIIESIRHKTLPILAVQWHPERLSLNFAREDCANGLTVIKYFLNNL